MKRTDFTNKKFGKITAILCVGKIGSRIAWLCKCDCGNEKIVQSNNIGRTTFSCGCEKIKKLINNKFRTTHGKFGTREYRSWNSMMMRCTNPKSKDFVHYGGRGISVCSKWHKFENFYKDLGDRPIGKTLDRINTDGDYKKENCRWATYKEQANNRRVKRISKISS